MVAPNIAGDLVEKQAVCGMSNVDSTWTGKRIAIQLLCKDYTGNSTSTIWKKGEIPPLAEDTPAIVCQGGSHGKRGQTKGNGTCSVGRLHHWKLTCQNQEVPNGYHTAMIPILVHLLWLNVYTREPLFGSYPSVHGKQTPYIRYSFRRLEILGRRHH